MIRPMTHAGRPIGTLDIALAAVLSVLGLLLVSANAADAEVQASFVAVPFFLAVTVPLVWRRAAPLRALGATLVALVAHVAAFGTMTRCGVLFPVTWLLAFAAGATLERDDALKGLALSLAIVVAFVLADFSIGPEVLPVFLPVTALIWGAGRLLHARGEMAAELRARNEALREARDERARLEVATDRARLSGELDELLQRRLGELARLADQGADMTEPGAATVTLVDIEHESRRTLAEMREVVGLLRTDDADAPLAPLPTLTHLEALLVRAKGADAHLTVQGSPRALPAGVELSAYRVVEHLLEAVEDVPGVDVTVAFGDDALELRVAGRARRWGDASGAIERARDRVQMHRGTLRTTSRGGRSEAVAQLPVLAGA
jgi:hypothetical protein